MTMTYFRDCTSPQQIKTLYRRWCMRLHPDRGGKTAEFQSMKQEYLSALSGLHGYTERGGDDREHTYYYNATSESALMEMVDRLVFLDMDDVRIRLIGSWIWVDGETKFYASVLGKRGLGLRWHAKREAWYWHLPSRRRTRYNAGATLEDLEQSYGSQTFDGSQRNRNGMTSR